MLQKLIFQNFSGSMRFLKPTKTKKRVVLARVHSYWNAEFRNFRDFPEFSSELLKFPERSGPIAFSGIFSEFKKKSKRNRGTFDSHEVGEIAEQKVSESRNF